jgi:hypothetical protein
MPRTKLEPDFTQLAPGDDDDAMTTTHGAVRLTMSALGLPSNYPCGGKFPRSAGRSVSGCSVL